jgi:hypothetical protein
MGDELLFNKYEIFGVVQAQTEAVKKKLQAIPPNTLLTASEHDLVQALIQDFRLDVPIIVEDEIYIANSGEHAVDVSWDPMRAISLEELQDAMIVGGYRDHLRMEVKKLADQWDHAREQAGVSSGRVSSNPNIPLVRQKKETR